MAHSDGLVRETEDRYQRERIRYDWMLQSVQKFRIFFAGLVFTMLAFAIQFPVRSPEAGVWPVQVLGWLALLVCGLLALRDAGGLVTKYTADVFDGLSPWWRGCMWADFVAALLLLGLARVLEFV